MLHFVLYFLFFFAFLRAANSANLGALIRLD